MRRASSRMRGERSLGARRAHHPCRIAASRHSPSAACSPPPAARCHAVGCLECRPRSRDPVRAREAPARGARGRARRGERRRWPRPCRPRARGWRRPRRSRRPGTARARGWTAGTPRSAGSRDAAMCRRGAAMWTTASSKRCWMRASSPRTASRRTWSHGSSTVLQPAARPESTASTLRVSSPAEIAARAAKSQLAAWSHGRSSPRRARRCDRSARARGGTRRDATRRRRGSTSTALAGRHR